MRPILHHRHLQLERLRSVREAVCSSHRIGHRFVPANISISTRNANPIIVILPIHYSSYKSLCCLYIVWVYGLNFQQYFLQRSRNVANIHIV